MGLGEVRGYRGYSENSKKVRKRGRREVL